MKTTKILAAGLVFVALVLFFFYAPVIPMDIIPCFSAGKGYASLSYRLFYIGEIYLGGQFAWDTFNAQNCI